MTINTVTSAFHVYLLIKAMMDKTMGYKLVDMTSFYSPNQFGQLQMLWLPIDHCMAVVRVILNHCANKNTSEEVCLIPHA